MNLDRTAEKLPVFLVLDYTGDMWRYIPSLEHYMRDLAERLRSEGLWSRVELGLVGMGGKTGVLRIEDVIKGQSGRLARRLPVCNLSAALGSVLRALQGRKTLYEVKGEVFIILGSNPGKPTWAKYVQELEALRVNVTPIAFAFMSKSLTAEVLGQLKTGRGKLLRLDRKVSDADLKWLFHEAMPSQIKAALATAKAPTAVPVPSQANQGGNARVGTVPIPREGRTESPSPGKDAEERPGRRAAIKLSNKGAPSDGAVASGTPAGQNMAGGMDAAQAKGDSHEAADSSEDELIVADSQGIAVNWRHLEPSDPTDPVKHKITDKKSMPGGWHLVGASQRGKMHAHKGIYREDAFALGGVDGWQLMVVADGGGSCPLARVGSQVAADTAMGTMVQHIESLSTSSLDSIDICKTALRMGLEAAWVALESEAQKRQVPLGHLGTTYLSVVHRSDEQGSVVGIVQVGDGLVAAEFTNGKIVSLAEPDVGETAGVTVFLTSEHWKDWLDRISVQPIQAKIRLLVAMCDGVADDFIPFERHLPELFAALHRSVLANQENPEGALLDFLGYDKRGSFDDRTLTLVYQMEPEKADLAGSS